MTTRIVIAEFMDEAAVATLQAAEAEVLYDASLVDRPDELSRHAASADALIVRNRTQVRGALLDSLGRARAVGRLGVGLDNIDVEGCRARGIAVLPATGANAVSVAEYVAAAALVLMRGAFFATSETLVGGWPRLRLAEGHEIQGRVLGLVGFGAIARMVADRLVPFGLTVLAHDPLLDDGDPAWVRHGAHPASLGQVIAQSDILSLHVPLTEATRNLMDAAAIARMKQGAILINTARGGVVNEAAVAAALRSGQLSGAALDVFVEEPLPAGNPLVGAPNLIATPHIAGNTVESNEAVSALVARRVLDVLGLTTEAAR